MSKKSRFVIALSLSTALLASACGGERDREPRAQPPPKNCPLSGRSIPENLDVTRPAVGVKVENSPAAYPLSGVERAELVYEELVEGGITRFMAFYHCTDAAKVGPVRSARIVDPAIMKPITRILAGAGGNAIVERALKRERIITIDEDAAGDAMRRIPRRGLAFEHTLFANTSKIRRLGIERFHRPPRTTLFKFGALQEEGRNAKSITIRFSSGNVVVYRWARGQWQRFQERRPLKVEGGKQVAVDNVLIEQHRVALSRRIVDVTGNPSIEIEDVVGSGRAVLFRDGRAIPGRWERKSVSSRVRFVAASGQEMVLKPGTTWIELVPTDKGRVRGSFSFK